MANTALATKFARGPRYKPARRASVWARLVKAWRAFRQVQRAPLYVSREEITGMTLAQLRSCFRR